MTAQAEDLSPKTITLASLPHDLGRCLEPVVASQANMVKSVKQVAGGAKKAVVRLVSKRGGFLGLFRFKKR